MKKDFSDSQNHISNLLKEAYDLELQIDILQWTPPGLSLRFKGLADTYGIISVSRRNALLSFYNNACLRTWLNLSAQPLVACKYTSDELSNFIISEKISVDTLNETVPFPSPVLFEAGLRAFVEFEIERLSKRLEKIIRLIEEG